MTEPAEVPKRDAGESQANEHALDLLQLRNALGCFATGVTIITASGADGKRVGLTANSFSSVSLNPPLVSLSLSLHSPSLAVFQDASHFAVHVLAREQEDLAARFAQPADDKYAGLGMTEGLGGAPLLGGAVARFQCRNAYRYYGGDHVIFLGSVETFDSAPGDPLIFCRGQFGDLAAKS